MSCAWWSSMRRMICDDRTRGLMRSLSARPDVGEDGRAGGAHLRLRRRVDLEHPVVALE